MSSPLLETLRRSLSGQFDVERELGGGGMAHVFLAREGALGRQVVLKVLPPDAVGGVSVDRFKREVQVAARLQHPHIVPLLTAGEMDGIPWYTMPFIDGESLRAKLSREHELPVPDAIRILREVADALAYAHAHDVVHRDIKPDNVLLSGQHALVTDFGIAKAIASARATGATPGEGMTSFGVALGTPAYMAPEQASADPNVDHRADIYGLGALGYELLTGHAVFSGHSPQALLAAVIGAEPKPVLDLRPSVPPPLAQLVMRCLEKLPADRPQTAHEVLSELESIATPTGMHPASSRNRRRMGFVVAATVAFAATAFGVYRVRRPPVDSSATVISVLPFAPASADTTLTRLGRDLVLTVSTNLDGVGALRATDPMATLASAETGPISEEQAVALARRYRARSFVMGSLTREGGRVRVDFTLRATDGSAALARGSVSAPIDSLSALTDSLTWSLLRQIWRHDQPPTPSVAALTTKSIPALRAYLEGERLRGDGHWNGAVAAFDRAIEADSTFWLAYVRNVSTRGWMFMPVDSVLARYRQHLDELPERDRLVILAGRLPRVSDRIAQYQRIATRFPDNWTAVEAAGDLAFHEGPTLGIPLDRARADLERVVTLNPRWTEAWQHLLVLAQMHGGLRGPGADSITRIMRGFGYDSTSAQSFGFSELSAYELVARLMEDPAAINSPLADSVVGGWKRARLTSLLASLSPSFPLLVGGGAPQIAMSERALRLSLPEALTAGHRSAVMWAWASRGAYDSALVAAERSAAGLATPGSRMDVLRVAALAQYSGAIPGAFEARWSVIWPLVARVQGARTEALWLRGVTAAGLRDTATVASALQQLEVIGRDSAATGARYYSRELRAFQVAARGDETRAADSLMTVEYEIAETGSPGFHIALARTAAARWLQASGRTGEAESLLRWHEALIPSRPSWSAKLMFEPLVMLERGRLAEARGDPAAAERFFSEFVRRFDRPMPAHQPLVAEARAALERLGRNRRGS